MRRACMIILMVLMTALLPVAAGALEFPHNADISQNKNFKCSQCHLTGRSAGLKRFENFCYGCHVGNPSVRPKHTVTAGDSSNVFYSITTNKFKNLTEAEKKMTSHNWVGLDNQPAAGSVSPTSGPLYKSAINGTVSCARCHWVHSTGTAYQQNKPLLRMANDQDQLCVECHKPRNTRDTTTGTHPVAFKYASSASIRGVFWMYTAPRNTVNPANPTASLKNYLKKGRVVCSTCHGIHKTDSNSATFDAYTTSSMSPPANAKKGKGMLLRTDFVRPDGTTANICPNCHTYGNHNKKYGTNNIQCTYCHSAHVTTDHNGNVISGLPNNDLVNRYMNYSAISIAGGNVRTIAVFRQSTSNSELYRTDKKGLCQVCHPSSMSSMGVASGHLIGGVLDNTYAKCNTCHPHTGTTSFTPNGAAACGACHGRPPRLNKPGNKKYAGYVDGGYAVYTSGTVSFASYSTAKNGSNNIKKDESKTPHWRHSAAAYDVEPDNYGLACDECHKGNSHRNRTYQDVFEVPATNFPKAHPLPGEGVTAPIAGLFAKNFARYTSNNATTGTCSNIYCHSNGAPRNMSFNIYTGLVYKTIPLWPNGAGTISAAAGNRCNACHGNSATLVTNSHAKHRDVNTGNAVMGAAITCNVCHKNTLSLTNYTTIDYAGNKHVNGLKDVVFADPYGAASMSWTASNGTCSNACHADGQGSGYGTGVAATWGNTPAERCGLCHAFPPTTGSHTAHMPSNTTLLHRSYTSAGVWSSAGDYVFGCANCHPKDLTKHIDGAVQVTLSNAAGHSGPLNNKNKATDDTSGWSKNAGQFYCFASYCHSNGAWNSSFATYRTYSSPDWYNAAAYTATGDKCAMCHGNSPNSTRSYGNKYMEGSPAHYNPNSMGTGKSGGHFVGIHYNDIYSGGNGKATTASPAGFKSHGESTYSTTINCDTCHYVTVTNPRNDKNTVCFSCHGAESNPASIASKLKHINGVRDVSFNPIQVKSKAQLKQKSFDLYSLAVAKRYPASTSYKVSGAYDQGKQAIGTWSSPNCSNISCHNGIPVGWDTNMSLNTCSNCHNAL
ncbi:MAG: CxxxxCH/CxxCH domain-containing protein [Geobacter sp.]|nr:CxxxxCH/CxxCH domain-containing protein [Geobacter sp.]